MATGFNWAGIKPLIAVEWSPTTAETYAFNHNADILVLSDYLNRPNDFSKLFCSNSRTLLIQGDINLVSNELIKKILIERFNTSTVDIVSGGAPCESFSLAGDRKEHDERNVLFENIIRVAKSIDAKFFLFENVKGLFSKKMKGKAGGMYDYLCSRFESKEKGKPAYHLASKEKDTVLLKAVDYGVPQFRERLFLVGINNKFTNLNFSYPVPTHGDNCELGYITVEDAIMDLPQIRKGEIAETYISNDNFKTKESEWFINIMRGYSLAAEHNIDRLYNHKAPGHVDKMYNRICEIKPGESMKTAYERLIRDGEVEKAKKYFPKKIYGARNRRLLLDSPSFTVTSHCLDEMIHPVLDRGLSPREAARLQSFPDWYDFKGPYVEFHGSFIQDQYEQIGDAIPPLLAYAIARELVNSLNHLGRKK